MEHRRAICDCPARVGGREFVLLRARDLGTRYFFQGAREKEGMIPRFYVDAPLRAGAIVELDPARSHYLAHVLRRERGAPVLLFNGREGEWQASIDGLAK